MAAACSISDCKRPVRARGWCDTHWHRWRRNGDPETIRVRTRSQCSVKDCGQDVKRQGLCNLHIQRMVRLGTTELPVRLKTVRVKPVDKPVERTRAACTLCGKPAVGRKLCNTHYARWRRTGSADPAPAKTLRERFEEKIDRDGPVPAARPELGPCWLWTAATDKGYGRIARGGGRGAVGAHIVSHELCIGPVPVGYEVDHLCRTTLCVNPNHLEAVTGAENLRRQAAAWTRCRKGHALTPENTVRSGGRRHCRTCKNANQRARRLLVPAKGI